jgi:outer membrane protein insertion porin family
MKAVVFAALVTLTGSQAMAAQQQPQQRACGTVDSVAVTGTQRLTPTTVISRAGIPIGDQVCPRDVQRAIQLLYETGQISDIQVFQTRQNNLQVLILEITERPMLGRWTVEGAAEVSERRVRGRVQLLEGRPYDPAAAARSRASIDSLYRQQGFYLTDVRLRETTEDDGSVTVAFDIREGQRVAISRIVVEDNDQFDDGEVVHHMKSGAEGFWWWKKGEYNEEELERDIRERLPDFYGSRGYVDFQVLADTLVMHEESGKGTLTLRLTEGQQHEVGSFEIVGNRFFTNEQLELLYPFGVRTTGFLGLGGTRTGRATFDASEWEEATGEVGQAYANEGYIYARVIPSVTKRVTDDGENLVDLRWQIVEGSPAIVNRVVIRGNSVTHEDVIRRAIHVVPGDVFRQDALIASYQNISNLGFFEQPLPPPITEQANQQGDIDIIFVVEERHTGNVNFGASVGQGVGVGGFIGLDEPNLFGRGKRVQFQWQFGQNINDLNITYSDPALRGSLISGTLTLHNSRLRYTVADLGRITTRGAKIQFGFPVLGSRYTRLLASYAIEQSQYDSPTLSSRYLCDNCALSSVGLTLVRDTRIGLPFATGGTMHQAAFSWNGRILGGSGNFRRANLEGRWYALLGQLGNPAELGAGGPQFVFGLTAKAGFVWGDVGPHFRQLFSMGGNQFGIPLRGYDEFSITPAGFDPSASGFRANTVDAFGAAYHATTVEVGLRLSQALYLNTFFDAGNVWESPGEYNPTRVFRGAGIGLSLLSPLGPIGLDYAYGFDRVDRFGNSNPGWKFHFKLGNFF